MRHRYKPVALVLLFGSLFLPPRSIMPGVKEDLEKAREDVIRLTQNYTAELAHLLTLQQTACARAVQVVNTRRTLFDQGLISRIEFEESEGELEDANRRLAEIKQQMVDAERTIDEVKLALEEDSRKSEPDFSIIRFAGKSPWSLRSVSKIQRFFQTRFGENLPVSAYGQTPLHERFGLAHQNAIDIAVHPDSLEGRALIEFLRESGTSFIAFRSAVSGSATGAHIHIGPPSQRLRSSV